MVNKRGESAKRKKTQDTSGNSSLEYSTTGAEENTTTPCKTGEKKPAKKQKQLSNTKSSGETSGLVSIREHFPAVNRIDDTGAAKGGTGDGNTEQPIPGRDREISNADLWKQLMVVIDKIDSIKREVDEVKSVVFELQRENDMLKREIAGCRKEESAVARKKSEALEQYTRRNNIRIFGVEEEQQETNTRCEAKVIDILKNKLGLKTIKIEDLEVAHRVSRRGQDRDDRRHSKPRPIIARFVSRRSLHAVFQNRKKTERYGCSHSRGPYSC